MGSLDDMQKLQQHWLQSADVQSSSWYHDGPPSETGNDYPGGSPGGSCSSRSRHGVVPLRGGDSSDFALRVSPSVDGIAPTPTPPLRRSLAGRHSSDESALTNLVSPVNEIKHPGRTSTVSDGMVSRGAENGGLENSISTPSSGHARTAVVCSEDEENERPQNSRDFVVKERKRKKKKRTPQVNANGKPSNNLTSTSTTTSSTTMQRSHVKSATTTSVTTASSPVTATELRKHDYTTNNLAEKLNKIFSWQT